MMKKILFFMFFLGGKLCAQDISVAEYFWDTDPGPGLATPVEVVFPLDTVSMSAEVRTSGLAPGTHYLYFRTRDENGKWSLSEGRSVTVVSSIIALEYFWDSDPGPGSGNPISIVVPLDSLNLFQDISTSGLTAGIHYLYVRSKDNSNMWSLGEGRPVNIIQSIMKAEYFWDVDPGTGAGTPMMIPTPADSVSFNCAVMTTGLGMGNHVLYFRTLDNAGRWSLSEGRPLTIQPSVVSAEYFWDTDPGIGLGNQVGLNSPPDDSLNLNVTVVTEGLSFGSHFLYVRTRDQAGRWSLAEGRPVSIISSIVAAEYFWDTDPGPGSGNSLTVSVSRDSVMISTILPTDGLNEGIHYLYSRTKDNAGKWSLSEGRTVTIQPSITAAEYFWDTDPGFGLGTSMYIPQAPLDSVSFFQSLSTCGLTPGIHYLYVRTKDSKGRWSLAESRSLTVTPASSPCPNFNFRAFLEGKYSGGRTMTATLFNVGLSGDERATDSITVELWSPTDLSSPVFSQNGILRSNGAIQMEFPSDFFGNSYFVVIRHRSSIETWSKEPVMFNAHMVSFDLTSP